MPALVNRCWKNAGGCGSAGTSLYLHSSTSHGVLPVVGGLGVTVTPLHAHRANARLLAATNRAIERTKHGAMLLIACAPSAPAIEQYSFQQVRQIPCATLRTCPGTSGTRGPTCAT